MCLAVQSDKAWSRPVRQAAEVMPRQSPAEQRQEVAPQGTGQLALARDRPTDVVRHRPHRRGNIRPESMMLRSTYPISSTFGHRL